MPENRIHRTSSARSAPVARSRTCTVSQSAPPLATAYARYLASGDGANCASESDPSGDSTLGSMTSTGSAVGLVRE